MKKILIVTVLLTGAFGVQANAQKSALTVQTADCEPMSAEDYRAVMTILVGRASEETKLKAAKKSLKNGCVNLDQLSEMMDHLQGEAAKLDFAKAAYSKCTDQDNFLEIVQEKFESAESVEELNGHITPLK